MAQARLTATHWGNYLVGQEARQLHPTNPTLRRVHQSFALCHKADIRLQQPAGQKPPGFGPLVGVIRSTKSSSTIKWKHRRALAEGLIIRR
jgi:hypothetical protein